MRVENWLFEQLDHTVHYIRTVEIKSDVSLKQAKLNTHIQI